MRMKLNSFLVEDNDLLSRNIQYHDAWPEIISSQNINTNPS